ncbi:MAG: hypothetical protein HDS03_05450 [Bacteroides sp.]|nr:hypothetical protein [Bacteroides sp.]
MRRILSLLFGCVFAMLNLYATAQTSQVATLLSGEDVKIYFGPESFKQAVDESKDGDVITLSAGTFDAPAEIDKQLTVRGAGMGLEGFEPYVIPTIVNGTCTLRNDFSGEGLRFNTFVFLYDMTYTFCKCYVDQFSTNGNTILNLVQSFVKEPLYLGSPNNSNKNNLTAINCVLGWASASKYSHENFINCIINYVSGVSLSNATFTNCIIRNYQENPINEDSSNTYYYCLFYGKNGGSSFDNLNTNGTCFGSNTINDVYKKDGFYELLDEYKTLKGSDEKEIGIYGGNLGFDITPNNPQITRFNVAPKTSADGKLSVEIEVKGVE